MALPVVTGDQTTTLAWFAELAYEDAYTTSDALGWHLVSGSELGMSDTLLSSGRYVYQNGSALVASANFNGSDVLAISFRGSDDKADWVTNITDIDEHFELFASLTNAAVSSLEVGTYDAILVTGHSLGGAMTEVFLHSYGNEDIYGISWGSPGIHMDSAVVDDRLINYVFTDDGVAWLGTQRDDIADEISLTSLGDAVTVAEVLGISPFSLVAAIDDLDTDYHHHGTTALITATGDYVGYWDPGITLDTLKNYTDQHDMGRYLAASDDISLNPFALPDSTVAGSTLTASQTTVVELYATIYGTAPSGDSLQTYSAWLDAGSGQAQVVASMLDGSGLRGAPPDAFLDRLFENVLGRLPTANEKNAVMWDSQYSNPADIVVEIANSTFADTEVADTVNLVTLMGTYDYI